MNPLQRAIGLMLSVSLLIGGAALAQTDTPQPFTGQTISLVVAGDPFGITLQNTLAALEQRSGADIQLEVVSYNDMRRLTLLNARDARSTFDIVSFDVVWVGEYVSDGVLLPLSHRIENSTLLEPDDFLPSAYDASVVDGVQYGLPIQPHPELLSYRVDAFEQAGIAPPQTTDDVLAAAAELYDPANGLYGICWNAQRGQALGQQMAHFYGAFGQPLLDADGQPTLDTARGQAAAQYALDLLRWSPPDILTMAWDQRILRYSRGGCAMTYTWGARAYLIEEHSTDGVWLSTGFGLAPHAPDAEPVTPLGVWSLGIPANIGERADIAWAFLEWLSSPEIQHYLAQQGNGGVNRYSLLSDPVLQEQYPTYAVVLELDADDALQSWMRPAVPQWADLAQIMGEVYHDMLRGDLTPEQATAEAQRRAQELFDDAG